MSLSPPFRAYILVHSFCEDGTLFQLQLAKKIHCEIAQEALIQHFALALSIALSKSDVISITDSLRTS